MLHANPLVVRRMSVHLAQWLRTMNHRTSTVQLISLCVTRKLGGGSLCLHYMIIRRQDHNQQNQDKMMNESYSNMTDNKTMAEESNTTYTKVDEAVINYDSIDWTTHMAAAGLVSLAFLGCHLHGSLIGYLNKKPPGKESLIDIPNRVLFRSLQGNCLCWGTMTIVRSYFVDPGDTFAKIWMWPAFDFLTITIIFLGLNPLIQIVLFRNPSTILPISDQTLNRVLTIGTCAALALMNLICQVNGYLPPSYYSIRGMKAKFPLFQQIRDGSFVIQAIFFTIIRIFLRTKTHKKTESTQILSNRVILFNINSMIFGLSLFHVFGFPHNAVLHFGSILFHNIMPATIIISNQATREYFSQNHKFLSTLIGKLLKFGSLLKPRRRVEPAQELQAIRQASAA